jgi:hypothetical protein
MTLVHIDSGICGFSTHVRLAKIDQKSVSISLESGCEQVAALAKQLGRLSLADVFSRISQNPVYQKAEACRLHPSCPVPCGVLKGAEVELGLALKKDVVIELRDD